MTDDFTRCADGIGSCPLADQCARTAATNVPYTLHVYFWLAIPEDQKCLHFISKEIME